MGEWSGGTITTEFYGISGISPLAESRAMDASLRDERFAGADDARRLQQNFSCYDIYLTDDTDIVVIARPPIAAVFPIGPVTKWPMGRGWSNERNVADTRVALGAASSRLEALSPLVATVRPIFGFRAGADLGARRQISAGGQRRDSRISNDSSFDIASALSGLRMPFASDARSLANVPRLQMRARGARLRLFPSDSAAADTGYAAVAKRHRSFER